MTRQLSVCLIIKLFLPVICNVQSNSDEDVTKPPYTKVYESNDLEWLHYFDIVVPTGHTNEVKLTAPNGPLNKTEIDIEMFAVEIIEFDVKMQQFTIRMGLEINWSEKRLKLVNSSLVNGWIRIKDPFAGSDGFEYVPKNPVGKPDFFCT